MSANLNGSRYEEHLLGCADIVVQVAKKLGLRDDAAVQACFATVCIDAQRHGVFMEPTPRNGKTPVAEQSAAPASAPTPKPLPGPNDPLPQRQTPPKGEVVGENLGALRDATPEQAEGANRTALLEGVEKVRTLLNKEGYSPVLTPKALNEIIKSDFNRPDANLGSLDADDLAELLKKLNTTLDTFRANKKAMEADAPF